MNDGKERFRGFLDAHEYAPPSVSDGQLAWAVLQGFRNVGGADLVRGGEVGDGAGEFDDAVMGAGGEVHLAGGGAHQLLARRVQWAVLAYLARPHVRVRDARCLGEAGALPHTGGLDARPDGR